MRTTWLYLDLCLVFGDILLNLFSCSFFLMCYLFINATCALQTILRTPSWRPRFRYYQWTLSVCGVVLNFMLAIMAGWYYALIAFSIAAFVYAYITYKGFERNIKILIFYSFIKTGSKDNKQCSTRYKLYKLMG